ERDPDQRPPPEPGRVAKPIENVPQTPPGQGLRDALEGLRREPRRRGRADARVVVPQREFAGQAPERLVGGEGLLDLLRPPPPSPAAARRRRPASRPTSFT